jgi:hypothetical protein
MYSTVLISFASNICLHVCRININRILHVVRKLKLKALILQIFFISLCVTKKYVSLFVWDVFTKKTLSK